MSAVIETERLILREWREADVAPFHAIGQDAEVMQHLGPLMTEADARAVVARMQATQRDHGYCFWALERREDGAFLGFCGLKPGPAGTPIADDVEIGWRLARACWGRGYAREAAEASLAWGWRTLTVPEIAAITTRDNIRSWGLMERLGMVRQPAEDFNYPALAADDPLRPHITYRATRPA